MSEILLGHSYWLLFIGMLVGGETFLLPALYLTFLGKLELSTVLWVAALATLLSDTFWYLVGRYLPLSKLSQWEFFKKRQERTEKWGDFLKRHQYKVLFFSKFIYGVRTIVQILSGIHKMNILRYWVVNLSGVFTYLAVMIVLGFAVDQTFSGVKTLRFGAFIVFSIYVFVAVGFHLVVKRFAKKQWSQ